MRKVNSVSVVTRDDFAHAILEARLRDSFIDITYREDLFDTDTTPIMEPLHGTTAGRVIECIENLAAQISSATRNRSKIVTTRLLFSKNNITLKVFEFEEVK